MEKFGWRLWCVMSSSLSWQTCLGKAEGHNFGEYVGFDIYDHNLRGLGIPSALTYISLRSDRRAS